MSTSEPRAFEKAAGLRIQQRREALSMSKKALAMEAGYASHSMLSEIEQGLQMPSYEKLVAIARTLRVSVDWILGVEGAQEPGIPPEQLAQTEAVLHCTSAQLRAVADALDGLCPLPS